jgi:IclR family pca regulon transcriptional regulator
VLADLELRWLTSRTVRSPQALRAEIDRGRRQDYARSWRSGLRSHRGPDPRPGRRGVAAINVSTLASRTTVVDMRRRLLRPLRETAVPVASDLAARG